MRPLWHYTCEHGWASLGEEGYVIPGRKLSERATTMAGQFSWFTDLAVPIRDALGLTQQLAKCDRTAYRYRVTDPVDVWPWVEWARLIPRDDRVALEAAPGARPKHWYVAVLPVPVVLDLRP